MMTHRGGQNGFDGDGNLNVDAPADKGQRTSSRSRSPSRSRSTSTSTRTVSSHGQQTIVILLQVLSDVLTEDTAVEDVSQPDSPFEASQDSSLEDTFQEGSPDVLTEASGQDSPQDTTEEPHEDALQDATASLDAPEPSIDALAPDAPVDAPRDSAPADATPGVTGSVDDIVESGGGCGCSVPGNAKASGAFAALAVLGLAMVRRRRP